MIAPYPVLAVTIVVVALVIRLILGARATRLGHPIPVLPTAIATVILLVLTIIFDNLMIAAGLMRYSPDEISGIMLGLVPIEDLSYPVAVAILMPALWHQPRKAAHE